MNFYGLVHHYAAAQEIEPIDFLDVLWLGDDSTYLFSISNFGFRYDNLCCYIKKNSYDSPSSA